MSEYIIGEIAAASVPNAPTGKFTLFLDTDGFWKKKDDAGVVTLVSGVTDTDELVKISSGDTTASYLGDKLLSTTDIQINFNNIGANENLSVELTNTIKNFLLDRANHTGTQTASTISDFDTEVSNNTDVVANTAKLSSLEEKSGVVLNAAFSGNPKTATVTFSTAFSDANYSPILTCNTINGNAYTPIVENITASGFDINITVNNINNLTDVRWVAIKHGEN